MPFGRHEYHGKVIKVKNVNANERLTCGMLILLSFVIAGCATVPASSPEETRQHIMKDYLTKIDKSDGINQGEALLLARSQFMFRGQEARFNLDAPELVLSDDTYWIYKFYRVNKTLEESLNSKDVLIRINKGNGSLTWSEE